MKLPCLRHFDASIAKYVARLPDRLRRPAYIIAIVFVPVSWMIVLFLFVTVSSGQAQRFAFFCLLSIPLGTLIKLAFRRQRPPTIYAGQMRIKSYSFPSSHAYSATVAGGCLAVVATQHALAIVSGLLVLLIFAIGVSRIFLGAHYPSDVIGGWVLGIGMVAVCYVL